MARLGQYEYPGTTVEEAVALSKKLEGSFERGQAPKKAFARLNQQLSDLQLFGLVEIRNDKVRRTPLMQRLTDRRAQAGYPAALAEAVLNVPLFRALYQWLDGEVPEKKEQFVAALFGVARADPREHRPDIDRLWKLAQRTMEQLLAAAKAAPGNRVKIPRDQAAAFVEAFDPNGERDHTEIESDDK